MKLAIFSKKRTTKPDEKGNTRPFWTYLTTLVNKTSGEPLTVQVKFREACGAPEPDLCPCFIEVPQGKCNLSWGTYTNDEGEDNLVGLTNIIQESSRLLSQQVKGGKKHGTD